MIDPTGFRKDGMEPFFTQIALSVPPNEKQITPFLVQDGGSIKKCETLTKLLDFKDDTQVLQAWPGKKRTDVFYFTVGEIRKFYKGESQ